MIGTVSAVAGWVCTAVALAVFVVRTLDVRPQFLVVVASAAYLFVAASVLGLALSAAARSWPGVVVAVLVVAAQTATYAPWFVGQRRPAGGETVRVMTQNLLLGRASARELVDVVDRHDVDVVFLQELTPAAQGYLETAGLDRLLPHRWTQPDRSAFGAGVWSRFPLTDERSYPDLVTATLSAVATLPDGSSVTLVGVHPPAPWPRPPGPWRTDLHAVGEILQATSASVIVAGDFNATLDHAPFRALLTDGFRDGAEQAGSGLLRTWPADRSHPSAIGIDHVLTRAAVATSVRTVRVAGTDHLGLLATVVVPS